MGDILGNGQGQKTVVGGKSKKAGSLGGKGASRGGGGDRGNGASSSEMKARKGMEMNMPGEGE